MRLSCRHPAIHCERRRKPHGLPRDAIGSRVVTRVSSCPNRRHLRAGSDRVRNGRGTDHDSVGAGSVRGTFGVPVQRHTVATVARSTIATATVGGTTAKERSLEVREDRSASPHGDRLREDEETIAIVQARRRSVPVLSPAAKKNSGIDDVGSAVAQRANTSSRVCAARRCDTEPSPGNFQAFR